MNNEPNQSQWGQQPSQSQEQAQWGQQQQYVQPEWGQQPAQQYDQYSQYNQPQWGQQPSTQYTPPQYGANQYGVPSYAQAQPQGRQSDNFLMGWLATRLLIRVVVLVAVLMLCGGCALFALLTSLAHP
ncbi:MAG: hypothetical protein ACJ8DI_03895 [Ktedonobacteraceae bacterium]